MSTTVLSRHLIQPSPETTVTELTLPLLHFDIIWLYFHPVQRLLFFDFPCSRSHFLSNIVPTLKQSLAKALKHFPPLAGKIVHPVNGEKPYIRYSTGDSVSLIIAESENDFDHLTSNDFRVADDFYGCVPNLPPIQESPEEGDLIPAFSLQVTLFPEKGLCFGFTNHHAIGDASSIVSFIKAWAFVTKSNDNETFSDEKLLPYFDRTSIDDDKDGLHSFYWDLMKKSRPVISPPISFPLNKSRATFVVTKSDIEKLKRIVLKQRPEMSHVTTFTVTCAFVWVCLVEVETEDEGISDEQAEVFGFAADCRARLSPPLPATYFGNCLAFVKAETIYGKLKGDEGFLNAVECIGGAIKKTVYNPNGILDGAENWPIEFGGLIGKRLFGVAGSPRFDLYDVDYGWGKAKKFESVSIDGDTSMSLCKSRDFEGGLEIGLSRSRRILDALQSILTKRIESFI